MKTHRNGRVAGTQTITSIHKYTQWKISHQLKMLHQLHDNLGTDTHLSSWHKSTNPWKYDQNRDRQRSKQQHRELKWNSGTCLAVSWLPPLLWSLRQLEDKGGHRWLWDTALEEFSWPIYCLVVVVFFIQLFLLSVSLCLHLAPLLTSQEEAVDGKPHGRPRADHDWCFR